MKNKPMAIEEVLTEYVFENANLKIRNKELELALVELKNQLEDRLKSGSQNDLKTVLNELMEQDYGSFVKSLISLEKGINNDDILTEMYDKYMESDATLLNDLFDDIEFDLEQGDNIGEVQDD